MDTTRITLAICAVALLAIASDLLADSPMRGFVGTYETESAQVLTFAADPGDATKTATALIPAGAVLVGISGKVLTAGTNCTSVNIGDGSDADMYDATLAVTAGSGFTPTSATAAWTLVSVAARNVVVTAVGGNCFNLRIELRARYLLAPGV